MTCRNLLVALARGEVTTFKEEVGQGKDQGPVVRKPINLIQD